MDSILAQARGDGATDYELAEIEGDTRAQFPDADLSPYTYGDVYRIIYNVAGADDIVGITAAPSTSNNTDFGKQIQKQVGTHTYDDRDSVALFYDSTVNVVCNSAASWESPTAKKINISTASPRMMMTNSQAAKKHGQPDISPSRSEAARRLTVGNTRL